MISTRKSFVIKALPLVLIVFSISLVPIADGFLSESTAGWKHEMSPGDSQIGVWTLMNPTEEPINIEFQAEGQGSEFFVFEKLVTLEPESQTTFEFILTIPDDHKDNIEYRPQLFALQLQEAPEGGAAVVVFSYRMVANPIILIGDNPVFTPEIEPEVIEEEPVVESENQSFEAIEEKPMESIEEKLARIQEANKEVKVDDDFEESFEEEAVVDYEPEPEYTMEPETIATQTTTEEKIECNFFEMILSWFGFGKC